MSLFLRPLSLCLSVSLSLSRSAHARACNAVDCSQPKVINDLRTALTRGHDPLRDWDRVAERCPTAATWW
ncbi:hypothetical protein EUGRSUZ_I00578 [Eucalyptus grandis]|uniref:Uncharacterized protein n=2 Tax=Eucalyptus grandis TaxID=71139 RepID=A0ACC3JCF3_EUCGR|nr:hypothetical protein EUGRSUZ_I00578 [Eucalyptus grandis]